MTSSNWNLELLLLWFGIAAIVLLLIVVRGFSRESTLWRSWVAFRKRGPSDIAFMIRFNADWLSQTRNISLRRCNLDVQEKPIDLLPLIRQAQDLIRTFPEHVRMATILAPLSRRDDILRALRDQELAVKALINKWCALLYARWLENANRSLDLAKTDTLVDEFREAAESTADDYEFLAAVLAASQTRRAFVRGQISGGR